MAITCHFEEPTHDQQVGTFIYEADADEDPEELWSEALREISTDYAGHAIEMGFAENSCRITVWQPSYLNEVIGK